ncbi:hypothetical protein AKG34_26345 [Peribacillus butanolivorans]|uniref:hypothetical protein n=1 Tax=Peribacillus butanolivorans TaxID=421767 RepID=UPI0006A70E92|nr:hypothetical protein [Peribacillus butanolivorans]KON66465.1 hypothetical protein AKG34_26345 [Peribacillus butanolivorans]
MESSHFSIEKMSRESGDYIVYEWKDGVPEKIFENFGKHYGGLKEARQKIGEHLQKSGYTIDKVFEHQCIIHTRKNNPPESDEWTVGRYLIGV